MHRSPTRGPAGQGTSATFGDSSAVVASRRAGALTVAALGALWALSERLDLLDPYYLPGPVETAQAFWEMLTSDSINGIMLHEHILISLRRVGLGVGAGVGLGVPLGLAISLSRIMRGILDPLIGLFRHVPPLTFLPLLVVWFGVGEPPIVAMLFLGALFVMAFATRAGATDIRQSKVYTAYSLGASKWQILRHVTLPHALPDIFTGARVAISLGWATLVAAELVGSDIGLGAMIWTGRAFNRNAVVVLGILTIGVVGVTIEVTMRRLERRLLPWQGHG